MIRIVTPDLYDSSLALLRQMHRLRYRVFKQRMGWKVTCQGEEERDEFDLLEPVYILVLDQDEDVVGSWRILPTTGPNMLRDVFPQVLNGRPVPESETIWEISRFALDCPSDGQNCLANLNTVTSKLFCGLIHHCLQEGIDQVLAVYDPGIGRILPRVGVFPLWRSGPPKDRSVRAVVGLFDVDETVFARVLANAGFLGLVDHGAGQLEAVSTLPDVGIAARQTGLGDRVPQQGVQSHAG